MKKTDKKTMMMNNTELGMQKMEKEMKKIEKKMLMLNNRQLESQKHKKEEDNANGESENSEVKALKNPPPTSSTTLSKKRRRKKCDM